MLTLVLILVVVTGVLTDTKTNLIKPDCSQGFYRNKHGICAECSRCNFPQQESQACNQTHDAECDCFPGYYRDSVDGLCKECTKCPIGWGAFPACTNKSNTVCITCPRGSFSNVESSFKSCQSCTQCLENEVSLRKCTSQQDTLCFRVQSKTATEVSEVFCNGSNCATSDSNYFYTVPLYCSLLGAIIVGLLVYVVLRCRINKKRTVQAALFHKQLSQYQIIQQVPQCPYSYQQTGVYSGQPVASSTMYRNLPAEVRKLVHKKLSKDGCWLKLATCLGFLPSEISQIQQKATEQGQTLPAVTILLTEWSKREHSTVDCLVLALAGMELFDVVRILQTSSSNASLEMV